MILAHVDLPTIRIPADVRRASKNAEISCSRDRVPFGATCWIACSEAWPHHDRGKGWDAQAFLTLSVLSDHAVGDVRSPEPMAAVLEGTLFVVDPRIVHWLGWTDDRRYFGGKQAGWIGLQWEVPRQDARLEARRIVEHLGGTWAAISDVRYESWRPA